MKWNVVESITESESIFGMHLWITVEQSGLDFGASIQSPTAQKDSKCPCRMQGLMDNDKKPLCQHLTFTAEHISLFNFFVWYIYTYQKHLWDKSNMTQGWEKM